MTMTARYANWKAPAEDGQILIWPPPATLAEETRENFERLKDAHHVRVQNVPLSELRRAQRHWIGHTNDDELLIASGHQTELYHPGVWVKDLLANAAVRKIGGEAYHLAVDTDHPKHLDLRWPGTTLPLTDDPAITTAKWSGLLSSPSPAHLTVIQNELVRLSEHWKFEPMTIAFIESLRRQSLEPVALPASVTRAQHEIDWDLGLKHHALLVSPIVFSDPYLAFTYHVLSRADRFAADYNSSLAEYRQEAGITSLTRPMPDLQVATDSIEVPFWLDNLETGSRARAEVKRSKTGWTLEGFEFDPAADGWAAAATLGAHLRARSLRLSPRALTLTTFLRLLLVDQFIHGIGGGRYDQVTDRLIAKHFGMEPPRFAVTTATLFFPGAVGKTRVCVNCIAQEGHHLKHNILGDKKSAVLTQIQSLPRRSVQRSLAFHNMHSALSAAAADHPAIREWEARYRGVEQQDREDNVIFDRELFYAIQPRERLLSLIDQYNRAFS